MGVEKEADRLFQAKHVEEIRQVFDVFGFSDRGEAKWCRFCLFRVSQVVMYARC